MRRHGTLFDAVLLCWTSCSEEATADLSATLRSAQDDSFIVGGKLGLRFLGTKMTNADLAVRVRVWVGLLLACVRDKSRTYRTGNGMPNSLGFGQDAAAYSFVQDFAGVRQEFFHGDFACFYVG
jgi:hypothetical protein